MTGAQRDPDEQDALTSRLLWFRSDHPDAIVETEMVVAEEAMAVCRATLQTSDSGTATGHGSARHEEVGSFYVEEAENRALARALTMLGYTVGNDQEIQIHQDEDAAAPPVPVEMVSARTLLREEPDEAFEPEQVQQQDAPRPIREPEQQQPAQEADEDEGANVNWNKFWNWARPRGYTSARELNEMLGVENVLAFTPREVRQMLVKYEMDNPPGGQDE